MDAFRLRALQTTPDGGEISVELGMHGDMFARRNETAANDEACDRLLEPMWPRKRIAITAGLTLVLLAFLYGTVIVLRRAWLPILFAVYIVIGLSVAAGWTHLMFRRWSASTVVSIHFANMDSRARGRLSRFWWRFVLSLQGWIFGAAWPAALAVVALAWFRGRATDRLYEGNAIDIWFQELQPLFSFLVLVQLGLCCGLVLLQPKYTWYEIATVTILVSAVMLRQVSYFLMGSDLPAKLRTLPGNTYSKVVLILIGDYASLVVGVTAMASWSRHSQITWIRLQQSALDLLSLGRLYSAVNSGGMPRLLHNVSALPLSDLITIVAGTTFYFVVLRAVLQPKEFARKDDDHIEVSNNLSSRGDFKSALRQLAEVNTKSSDYYLASAKANLGQGRLEQAVFAARRAVEISEDVADVPIEEVYSVLWTAAAQSPTPGRFVNSLIQKAVLDGGNDGDLAITSLGLVRFHAITFDDIKGALSGNTTAYPLTCALTDERAPFELIRDCTPSERIDKIVRVFFLALLQANASSRSTAHVPGLSEQKEWDVGDCTLDRWLELVLQCTYRWEIVDAVAMLLGTLAEFRTGNVRDKCLETLEILTERVQHTTFAKQRIEYIKTLAGYEIPTSLAKAASQ